MATPTLYSTLIDRTSGENTFAGKKNIPLTHKFSFKAHFPVDDPDEVYSSLMSHTITIVDSSHFTDNQIAIGRSRLSNHPVSLQSLAIFSDLQLKTIKHIPIGEFREITYPIDWTKVVIIVHEHFDREVDDVSERQANIYQSCLLDGKYLYYQDGIMTLRNRLIPNSETRPYHPYIE